ncbi:MAG: hypothetical protein ACREJC_21645 [Tepidisphaeraceae bacterium]
MTWSINGHVKVKMTKLAGPNAVLSGVCECNSLSFRVAPGVAA